MNSVGSYLCSCNSGFTLASDKLGCDGKQAKIIIIIIVIFINLIFKLIFVLSQGLIKTS